MSLSQKFYFESLDRPWKKTFRLRRDSGKPLADSGGARGALPALSSLDGALLTSTEDIVERQEEILRAPP